MIDEPLTPAEQDFRALLETPGRYAVWAAECRARWEASPAGKAAVQRCRGGFQSSAGRKVAA